jgi:hypothetical protein
MKKFIPLLFLLLSTSSYAYNCTRGQNGDKAYAPPCKAGHYETDRPVGTLTAGSPLILIRDRKSSGKTNGF